MAAALSSFEASGHTVAVLAVDEQVVALIGLADALRDDAASTLARLREFGFAARICSGDVQGAVDQVARELGITRSHATGGMLPEEKLAEVRKAGAVMIGDGVNDAAALAAAEVGIAVAGGAEAALAAADIYISRPGLAGVAELVQAAKQTLRIVHRNVFIATSYNLLAGTLAVMGIMHPLMAAVLMPMSSVTVMSLTMLATRRLTKEGVR
jgi:Cu2+-exporting ATPase